MELWFWGALAAVFGSGISAFLFKVAAHRGYGAEVFTLYAGISSVVIFLPIAYIFSEPHSLNAGLMLLATGAGTLASTVGIMKVYALRYIDTTIYYPLFKLISPALAIAFGVVLFAEQFTSTEWIGLLAGLFVPLLLITKSEHMRQQHLVAGLFMVGITGCLAAVVTALHKYAVDLHGAILWILAFNCIGVTVGSIAIIIYQRGWRGIFVHCQNDTTIGLVWWAVIRSIVIALGSLGLLYAFLVGGSLGIVYTIQSFYILIPIVFSIIFYKEHWNLQKVIAIILSVAALVLLG